MASRRATSRIPIWLRVPLITILVVTGVLISPALLDAAGVAAGHGAGDDTEMDGGGHGPDDTGHTSGNDHGSGEEAERDGRDHGSGGDGAHGSGNGSEWGPERA